MTGPKGNSEFCFPETLNVPRGEAEGNIEVDAYRFAAVSKVHDLITCESKVQVVVALGRHEVLFALGRHGVLTNDT